MGFRSKLEVMMGHILFIQHKFKNRKEFMDAKLYMLDNYWDQTLDWFTTKAYQIKDKKSQDVAGYIDKVPEVVREYCLRRILE